MPGFQYVIVLNIPGLSVCEGSLNFKGYTGFTYFRQYERVLRMCGDAIMEEF